MARLALRLAENAPGTYYVDASCIDCGVCREVAPGLFAASPAGRSFVAHQPSGPAEARRAGMALAACPTASIGASERVLHERDVTAGTRGVERVLRGDDPVALGQGLGALPVPGHTAGSMALVYWPRRAGARPVGRGDARVAPRALAAPPLKGVVLAASRRRGRARRPSETG